MAGYDTWKAREPDPWEFEAQPTEEEADEPIQPEDYRFTADLLRKHKASGATALFEAVCRYNLDIILAALDLAGKE